jgi:predicted dehydrogenase
VACAALSSDLHVVLEKPMALTTDECDELMALAAERERLLVVYQNRRYDPDFVTMRSLVAAGDIGDLFQLDTFVGGYSQPCTYWHSNALVSGGAIFDWGSHYIDQILNLIDDPVDHVTGLNHKRKWMHATNADHAQVTITFTSGRQATFVNSDLAAVRSGSLGPLTEITSAFTFTGTEMDGNFRLDPTQGGGVLSTPGRPQSITGRQISSFALPAEQHLEVRGAHAVMRSGEGETFTNWKAPSSLHVGHTEEHFAPVDPFQSMVESVSARIGGHHDVHHDRVPAADSLRTAELLDQIRAASRA